MSNAYEIIISPIITEKSTKLVEEGKYTFKVEKAANKVEIKKAIEEIFKVTVENVNTVNVLPKSKKMGRYEGLKPAYKKAIVTVAKGQKIPGFTL